jgi:hypothetical protein
MKLFLLVLVNFIFINKSNSQTVIEIEIGSERKVTNVNVTGTFPNGDTSLRRSIIKNLSTSVFKGAKSGKYTVTVNYIVTKDGDIAEIRCENDPGYGMCEESVRIFKRFKAWKPAEAMGRRAGTYRSSISSFAQDEAYNCVKRYNYPLAERLKNYPFLVAADVMLVSFHDSIRRLPMQDNKVLISKLSETRILNSIEIDSLTSLLYNYAVKGDTFSYTPATCYIPRNAILFINARGEAFEFIEICFECNRTRLSSTSINDGISCQAKFSLLKKFFAELGIRYGISP